MRWRRKRKEMRNPADCKRALEQRPTWLIDGSANELLSGAEIKHYWACNRVWETRRWDRRLWRRVDVISRRAGLILDLCRFSDARRFDADFLKDRRSAGEAPAQRFDKAIVALGAFGTGCGA